MTWNIVSDSSCDLRTASFHSSCVRFETVPLRIQVGGREFVDDDALSVPALLSAMAVEKAASSSACPSPADFAGAFERGDRTVCFTLSSQLSGTYHAACIAREMVLEEHPEKQICVIDSRAAAGAMVLLIRRAQALMRPIVGTLLRSLGIHIIADATAEGTIHVADKARGVGKTYRAITALMKASKDCTDAEVVISHCENLEGAMALKRQILADLPVKQVDLLSCRGLTSFYAMEKGLIVGY